MKPQDIHTNPVPRLVRVSPFGHNKILIGPASNAYVVYNPYSKKYEVGIQFIAEGGETYRFLAAATDWENIIADVKRALKEVPE